MDQTYQLHKSSVCLHLAHYITFRLEHRLPSFQVPIPVQMECPLLFLTVPQTLAFMSSHVSVNLTLLQKNGLIDVMILT